MDTACNNIIKPTDGKPLIEVVPCNQTPGAWRAEAFDDDGGIEQAIFVGRRAEERAKAYAEILESLADQ